MSDYTKSTNFATKDSLSSGNALKIVKGTEIDTEFNNIATAVATKADLSSPTFTGTVTIPTATITTATITTATISAGTITGITDLAIADGGTGASTAANARTNLGLVIGTNVQAWDADLDTWATKTAPSGTVVGTSDSQTLTNKTLSTGTVFSTSAINTATAVASTSGTSVDFTGIPSWVKRISILFNNVSTNGSSALVVRIGSGSTTSSGYRSFQNGFNTAGGVAASYNSTGFIMESGSSASFSRVGSMILFTTGSNIWQQFGQNNQDNSSGNWTQGQVTLSGTLDRVIVTTLNGSDTFDAGSINILYE